MAINKTILTKLVEKTSNNENVKNFLEDIIIFESSPKNGWYDKKYKELLEKYCDEEKTE